jgi:pyruvate dehydrogenase E1 component
VTLAPEGGAHQSITTPSVVLEQPGCIAWEPAFAEDLEWTLLRALSLLGKPDGTSAYFRLSTRSLDQALAAVPEGVEARDRRREQAVSGGYVLRATAQAPSVTLVGMGAVMPEVVAAADELARVGIHADVICLTSADLIFRAVQAREGLQQGDDSILDELFPAGRAAPIVSVLDGHPHTLGFLSTINRQRITSLGVADFGESGDIDDLYEHFGIDVDTIVGTAIDATRPR